MTEIYQRMHQHILAVPILLRKQPSYNCPFLTRLYSFCPCRYCFSQKSKPRPKMAAITCKKKNHSRHFRLSVTESHHVDFPCYSALVLYSFNTSLTKSNGLAHDSHTNDNNNCGEPLLVHALVSFTTYLDAHLYRQAARTFQSVGCRLDYRLVVVKTEIL